MRVFLACFISMLLGSLVFSQSPTGSIGGIVFDPAAKAIPGADIIIVNDLTGVQYATKSNELGIYSASNLPPGPYRVQASKIGFKTLIRPDITVNVQDSITINFTLPVGATSIAITVKGGGPIIDATDASVSTVVDRQFAENLPMNGRSFQTLIYLTPGVVATPTNSGDSGQFSVNGQRAVSNYWMVDGVSANIGIGSGGLASGNGLGGTLGSFSALGGTNSLVSVDAMEEFRIQTSSFAPEFGRTPGAQISIVSRSGSNQFHGTVFDYLRNDLFDANNWFANAADLPKPRERQNDFGGTLSGPLKRDRTFFFFSYEGLRLRLPQTTLTTVPNLAARTGAVPALQPYLNAFPFDPKQPDLGDGSAQFNASYSNPASLDAYSLRLDEHLNGKLTLWGRFNYSPSEIDTRGGGGSALSVVSSNRITTQTLTLGLTWLLTPFSTNDLRFNYSHVDAKSTDAIDSFGGATPLTTFPFPGSFDLHNATFGMGIFSLTDGFIYAGLNGHNTQRQINFVDGLSLEKGSHSLKFGVDFRRLAPIQTPFLYGQTPYFLDVSDAESGNLAVGILQSSQRSVVSFRDFSLYGQDTWRLNRRFTMTYGARWDVDFAPASISGPALAAVTGYNLQHPASLALAAPGKSPFRTQFGNVAPRVGVAYSTIASGKWQSVLRGGFGLFYDLIDSEAGNITNGTYYPFGASVVVQGPAFGGSATFPFSTSAAAPPAITPKQGIQAFDPNLKVPYSLEWNVAFQQALGEQQSVTVSYIGSSGRRLLQSTYFQAPNANFDTALLVGDSASSGYNALQVQFQRRLSHGLQTLASYTLSHSIDDASAGSTGNFGNTTPPGGLAKQNRGPSDFDLRNTLSAAATYEVPSLRSKLPGTILFRGWSLENVVQVRSALPVNVSVGTSSVLNGNRVQVRPDVVPGIPLYLYSSAFPGGKTLNNTPDVAGRGCLGPFCAPPRGQQGDLGRNALRGFGAEQWDFAVHRDFPIRELCKLQFRAEMFNVLNHPNFAPPASDIGMPNFGVSTETLGQYLGGTNANGGGLNSLYQFGGPRSIQLALKLIF